MNGSMLLSIHTETNSWQNKAGRFLQNKKNLGAEGSGNNCACIFMAGGVTYPPEGKKHIRITLFSGGT